MQEISDQENSEYGHFLRSVRQMYLQQKKLKNNQLVSSREEMLEFNLYSRAALMALIVLKK